MNKQTLCTIAISCNILLCLTGCSKTNAQSSSQPSRQVSPLANTHQIMDQTFNTVAGVYNYPEGWQAQSKLVWNTNNYTQPLMLHSAATSPDGTAALEFFPIEQFVFLQPSLAHAPMEAMNGAFWLAPCSASEAMAKYIVPKLRGKVAYQPVGIIQVPQLPSLINYPTSSTNATDAVCARISYQINGQAVDEEIYGILETCPPNTSHSSYVGNCTQYNWGFSRLFSFRAPQGQLDPNRDAFFAMVRSFRPNPQWQAIRQQVQALANQKHGFRLEATAQSIRNATMLSRQISANNAQFYANQAARRDQEYASDQMRLQARYGTADSGKMSQSEAFGDMMMGRETLADGKKIDGYHTNVWSDEQGNYLPSNDVNYNPNINSSSTWTLSPKAQ